MLNGIYEKVMGIKTDHGGVTFGDVVVVMLDIALLIYTGFRSYDLLTRSVPPGWEMMAYFGLIGLDGGMIGWSIAWIFGSTTKEQDWLTFGMWLIDAAGMFLTGIADNLLYAPNLQDAKALHDTIMMIAWYALPVIIAANALAGVVYHFLSDATRIRREERRKKKALERQRRLNEIALQDERDKANFARDAVLQRRVLVKLYDEVSRLAAEQAMAEEQIIRRLSETPLKANLGDNVLHRLGVAEGKEDGEQATTQSNPAPRTVEPVGMTPPGDNHHGDYTSLDLNLD